MNIKDLQQLKNLASFSLTQLEKLASNLAVKTFDKNEIVFDQDEEARFIYLLLSGIIRVSYIHSHERQTIVNLLPAGEFFGIDSLNPQARHAFRCEAFDDCSIGSIKPQTFVEIFLATPYDNFRRLVYCDHPSWKECVRSLHQRHRDGSTTAPCARAA